MASQPEVPKKVESAMIYQLRKRAIHKCQEKTEAFVACSEKRLFSVVWACRGQLNELNECTKQHTSDEAFFRLKTNWLERGSPRDVDWEDLMKDIS
eukprot:jgi/Ulvmu1/2707/UM014_0163.1